MNNLNQNPPDISKIPSGWIVENCDIELKDKDNFPIPYYMPVFTKGNGTAGIIRHFVKEHEVDSINQFMSNAPSMSPVSVQGMQDIKSESDIGSYRVTSWNPQLADQIWNRLRFIQHNMERVFGEETFNQYSPTDFWQGNISNTWQAVGVSPMLRYMKYKKGGFHKNHYDAGYIYPDNKFRTLKSFVLYLSTNVTGATVLVDDKQSKIPVWQRNHDDWDREVKLEEEIFRSYPVAGNLFVFQHRMAHCVSLYEGQEGYERIIIRGDIIYEAVNED